MGRKEIRARIRQIVGKTKSNAGKKKKVRAFASEALKDLQKWKPILPTHKRSASEIRRERKKLLDEISAEE